MLAQARPFRLPAADADVDVVALRKDPRVAARDGAELDDRPAAVVLARVNMVDVALERHAVRTVALQPERTDGQPVDPVCADRHRRRRSRAAEAHRHRVLVDLQPGRADAVAEVGAGCGCLVGEIRVEAPSLRHQDQRPLGVPLDAPLVAKAEPDVPNGVLDDRLDREGQLPDRPVGEPAAARLVAREALAVEQQHARARAREAERGGRSSGTGSDHDCIEALHWSMVRPAGGRRVQAPPSCRYDIEGSVQ